MTEYSERVNALREHADLIETSIELYGPSATRLLVYDLRNAAAAIEALQAQLPKRGEWIHVQEVDIPGEMHPAAFKCMCSMCRNEYLFPKIPRYCPDCGSMNTAKTEVQDG